MTLTIDIRELSAEDCIEAFELIASIRRMAIGKAAINFVLVQASGEDKQKIEIAKEYMRVFHIPGKIETE